MTRTILFLPPSSFHFPKKKLISFSPLPPLSISLCNKRSFLLMAATRDIQREPINNDDNVLQKHVAFFDRNQDGLVYPWETFQGFRAIGGSIFLSTVSALLINITLSYKTRPGKFPSLLFPIEVKNITKAKHGSDSGVYDTEGRFVPEKFEEIFHKYARSNSNALTSDELSKMLKGNRVPKDFFGWVAAWTEWKTLFSLCKDKNNLLPKETIRAVYDGSLFEKMEKETASAKKEQ